MPVPSTIADLSTTAGSNSPAGSDAIGTSLDDYLRTIQAIQKQVLSKGADIASATTPTFGNDGSYFVITGTTTITGFSDAWNGRTVAVKFSGALTLTHSASLILPGAANITTVAGDTAILTNESTGVWRCVLYQRGDGTPVVASAFSAVVDSTAIVKGSSDATKLLRFEVDGFTTGTTRVLTPPNSNATIAGIDVAQTFTASQRGTVTTDNDGSFDQSVTNNFSCTPTGNVALTFTNHTAGQSGFVLFINTGGYTGHSLAATTKASSTFLTTINATGTYLISYFDNGTNAYVATTGALS